MIDALFEAQLGDPRASSACGAGGGAPSLACPRGQELEAIALNAGRELPGIAGAQEARTTACAISFTSGALVKPSWLGRPTRRPPCAAPVACFVGSLDPHFCGPCNVKKGNRTPQHGLCRRTCHRSQELLRPSEAGTKKKDVLREPITIYFAPSRRNRMSASLDPSSSARS